MMKIKMEQKKRKPEGEEEPKTKKKVQRSSSRSSRGTQNNQKNKLLKYVCNRIDSGAKGWKTINNIFKDRPKAI